MGVPAIGCDCEVCTSSDPRNVRTRSSAILGLPEGNLLIDTGPDMRSQLIREGIGLVHSVAYTHEHSDHILGLDDLRLMQFYLGAAVPLYCESMVESRIRQVFDYAFSEAPETHVGASPRLSFQTIRPNEPFHALGSQLLPIRLKHGPRFDVLGFRIGDVAYCTDTNKIPVESWEHLLGLDVLIVDALRHKPHVTHFSLDEAVEVSIKLGAKRVFFTHCSHELDYATTNAALPSNMELAYDGQRIALF